MSDSYQGEWDGTGVPESTWDGPPGYVFVVDALEAKYIVDDDGDLLVTERPV